MEYIGTLNYYILEEGKEKSIEALDVHSDLSKSPYFFFPIRNNRPPEVAEDLPYIGPLMGRIVKELYRNYLPVFGNLNEFHNIVKETVNSTFFERPDFFSALGHPKNIAGYHYSTSWPSPTTRRIINPGFHINTNQKNIGNNILHEYGHRMHLKCCQEGITSFNYCDYDEENYEVMAILSEKIFGTSYFNPGIHKTALELLEKFAKLPEWGNRPFHQKWLHLLQFPKYEDLEQHIKKMQMGNFLDKVVESLSNN